MNQEEKYAKHMGGEYGVCAELTKREIMASLTYGNSKAADIFVINPENKKALKIEVKTSNSNRIVTGFFQKFHSPKILHPDFWVVVHIGKDYVSNYYVLSHTEMATVQMQRNAMTEWKQVTGVDNILLESILQYHNQWDKIKTLLNS